MIDKPAVPGHLLDVLGEVGARRVEQDTAWGHHDRPDLTWEALVHGEVAAAAAASTVTARRGALVGLAAVAVAWVQALDRRPAAEVPAPAPVWAAAVAGG